MNTKFLSAAVAFAFLTGNSIAIAAEPKDTGWFRFDSDGNGLQLWASIMHPVGPIAIASDIYVTSGNFGEFDTGPFFTIGPLSFTPMIGAGFDWGQKRMVNIIPQLNTFLDTGPVYFESLVQVFLNSPLTRGSNNDFYTRDFILYKLSPVIAIGPQVEESVALNNERNALISFPIGGHTNLQCGSADRLELFLGYETKKSARIESRGLVGRFTYVHSW
jgi:hypothetical protein